jgi:tRNA nucleotidyltransferase (CCA-adding enzyme)
MQPYRLLPSIVEIKPATSHHHLHENTSNGILRAPFILVLIMDVNRTTLLHAAVNGWRLAEHVRVLDETGLLATHLPELKALQGLEHNPMHHPEGGVWEHVLLCVEASESDDPVTNLAILFHDIGKGVTRSYGDDGRVHYYGHEAAGLPVFAGITERVGFTSEERRAIEFGMEMHMIGHKLDQLRDRKLLPLRSHPDWLTLFHVVKADEKVRMHLWDEPAFTARMQRVEELYVKAQAEQERESRLSALIDGRRIMEARPELAGKEVGRVKEVIRGEIVTRDYLVTPEEVAAWILAWPAAPGGR